MTTSKASGNAAKLRHVVDMQDPVYGVIADGVTDNYAAIMAVHNTAPAGSEIIVRGDVVFKSPLLFTRRLKWTCPGIRDFFHPILTNVQDAITVTGSVATLPMDMDINMFGLANCCSNGLVLRNVHYSDIKANVQVGAANYSFKVLGSLLSWFRLRSSVNSTNPLGSPWVGAKHLLVDVYAAVYCNANQYDVQFEGSGAGVTIADHNNEGNSTWRGTIEGITGKPFTVTNTYGMKIGGPLHLEGNSSNSLFTNCTSLRIEDVHALAQTIDLVSCRSCVIDKYEGGLTIDVASDYNRIGSIRSSGTTESFSDLSRTTIYEQGIGLDTSPGRLLGGAGNVTMENLFLNPFCDIWGGGTALPDGWSLGAGTFTRETGIVFIGNPAAQAIKVDSTAVALANCATASPQAPYLTPADDRVFSFMVPIYVATGQPDVSVYHYDGVTYTELQTVTQKDAFTVVRGSVSCTAGRPVRIVCAPLTAGTPGAGTFYVGGLSIVSGQTSPKFLCDSGRRMEYVVTAVGYTPSFKGQRAYVTGTGLWYLARGVSASTDWIQLN